MNPIHNRIIHAAMAKDKAEEEEAAKKAANDERILKAMLKK